MAPPRVECAEWAAAHSIGIGLLCCLSLYGLGGALGAMALACCTVTYEYPHSLQTHPCMQLVSEWLETNPAALNAIVSKALMAARASDAAKKARELVGGELGNFRHSHVIMYLIRALSVRPESRALALFCSPWLNSWCNPLRLVHSTNSWCTKAGALH